MNLNEMFDVVLVMSGQFLIPDSVIELRVDKFKKLVENCLGVWNNYNPIDRHVYINLQNGRQYTFTDNDEFGIPQNIVDLQPIRISGVAPFFLSEYGRLGDAMEVKKQFPWEYRKPTLTVPLTAEFDLHCIYNHRLEVDNSTGGEPAYKCTTISENDDEFFKMLTGRFMQSLGRSRRAFTLNELPITTDGGELVSEGKQMEDEAIADLVENKSKWYLAWR